MQRKVLRQSSKDTNENEDLNVKQTIFKGVNLFGKITIYKRKYNYLNSSI